MLVAHPTLVSVGVGSGDGDGSEGSAGSGGVRGGGDPLLRIVRRSSASVVTWRRAQMVLLSVQGLDVAGIAKVDVHQR